MYRHGLGIRGQYCGWGLELPRAKCALVPLVMVSLVPLVLVPLLLVPQLQALLVPLVLVPVVRVLLPDSAGRGSRFSCWLYAGMVVIV